MPAGFSHLMSIFREEIRSLQYFPEKSSLLKFKSQLIEQIKITILIFRRQWNRRSYVAKRIVIIIFNQSLTVPTDFKYTVSTDVTIKHQPVLSI